MRVIEKRESRCMRENERDQNEKENKRKREKDNGPWAKCEN